MTELNTASKPDVVPLKDFIGFKKSKEKEISELRSQLKEFADKVTSLSAKETEEKFAQEISGLSDEQRLIALRKSIVTDSKGLETLRKELSEKESAIKAQELLIKKKSIATKYSVDEESLEEAASEAEAELLALKKVHEGKVNDFQAVDLGTRSGTVQPKKSDALGRIRSGVHLNQYSKY
jgi:chromosome segregation ATPase